MMIFLHVLVAMTGLVVTGIACVSPSVLKLRLSYGFVALTMLSGAWLIVAGNAQMLHACISGLAYLAVALGGIVFARVRLNRLAV
jgi:hypothetical protein